MTQEQTEKDQKQRETPERAGNGGVCRGGLEKHPSHGLARWSLRGPPRTHIHTHRPHRTRPFVCAQAPARSAPSARSLAAQGAHATRDRRAARAHWPRAPQPEPGRGAGDLDGHPRGTGPKPRHSPARAKGREAARARSADSSHILCRSKDASKLGVAHREGRRGCREQAGPGFIAEPRREGAPTAGRGYRLLPLAEPPLPRPVPDLKSSISPPHPALCARPPRGLCVLSPQRTTPLPAHTPTAPPHPHLASAFGTG